MVNGHKQNKRPSKGERLNWTLESELSQLPIKAVKIKKSLISLQSIKGHKTTVPSIDICHPLIP